MRDMDINASIEEVWQVVGHEYADSYKWLSNLKHSDALNSERACDVSDFGKITKRMFEL